MNFLVRTYGGKCLTRPDTTFNKNKEDYYVPEDVTAIGWTPFVAARMAQAGKMIAPRFVDRYWDALAFGVLLYPSTDNGHFCRATGSCFDRTTMLPLPLYNICTLDDPGNSFEVSFGGRQIFRCGVEGIRQSIRDAICGCTLHSSVRRGDFVFCELAEISILCTRPLNAKPLGAKPLDARPLDETPASKASGPLHCEFCGNETLDISIIF